MSPEAARPVLVVGEALVDIVIAHGSSAGDGVEHVGGSPANVAIGLARLGHPVELMTHIGQDERGDRIAETLGRDHVALTEGSRNADRTPTATATLDERGAATYEFDLANELVEPSDLDRFGHLHAGSIGAVLQPGGAQVVDLVERAHDTHTISYDPNCRPSVMGPAHEVRSQMESLIGRSDVVKASADDLDWLYPGEDIAEVMRLWARLGPTVVVVTRDDKGAVLGMGHPLQLHEQQADPTTVVDTVGAGDSFMSGLISGLLDAGLLGSADARVRLRQATVDDVLPALRRALACGAVTVSRAGANPPTRAELAAQSG